jgi:hypothetical protein
LGGIDLGGIDFGGIDSGGIDFGGIDVIITVSGGRGRGSSNAFPTFAFADHNNNN